MKPYIKGTTGIQNKTDNQTARDEGKFGEESFSLAIEKVIGEYENLKFHVRPNWLSQIHLYSKYGSATPLPDDITLMEHETIYYDSTSDIGWQYKKKGAHQPIKYLEKKAGIHLDFSFENTINGNRIIGEKKRQGDVGNAHERVYKFFTPKFMNTVKQMLCCDYDPCVAVFSGRLAVKPEFVNEFETHLLNDQYYLWRDLQLTVEELESEARTFIETRVIPKIGS